MFMYKSIQQHSTITNGKKTTRRNIVEIHGKKGIKTTIMKESGKASRKKTMRLKKDEIECIRRCKFIPGLFNNCKPCA